MYVSLKAVCFDVSCWLGIEEGKVSQVFLFPFMGERENGGDRVKNHPPRLNITPGNVTQMSAGDRMGVEREKLRKQPIIQYSFESGYLASIS